MKFSLFLSAVAGAAALLVLAATPAIATPGVASITSKVSKVKFGETVLVTVKLWQATKEIGKVRLEPNSAFEIANPDVVFPPGVIEQNVKVTARTVILPTPPANSTKPHGIAPPKPKHPDGGYGLRIQAHFKGFPVNVHSFP